MGKYKVKIPVTLEFDSIPQQGLVEAAKEVLSLHLAAAAESPQENSNFVAFVVDKPLDVDYGDRADTSTQELAQEFIASAPSSDATEEKTLQAVSEEDVKQAEAPPLPPRLRGRAVEDPHIAKEAT